MYRFWARHNIESEVIWQDLLWRRFYQCRLIFADSCHINWPNFFGIKMRRDATQYMRWSLDFFISDEHIFLAADRSMAPIIVYLRRRSTKAEMNASRQNATCAPCLVINSMINNNSRYSAYSLSDLQLAACRRSTARSLLRRRGAMQLANAVFRGRRNEQTSNQVETDGVGSKEI